MYDKIYVGMYHDNVSNYCENAKKLADKYVDFLSSIDLSCISAEESDLLKEAIEFGYESLDMIYNMMQIIVETNEKVDRIESKLNNKRRLF